MIGSKENEVGSHQSQAILLHSVNMTLDGRESGSAKPIISPSYGSIAGCGPSTSWFTDRKKSATLVASRVTGPGCKTISCDISTIYIINKLLSYQRIASSRMSKYQHLKMDHIYALKIN